MAQRNVLADHLATDALMDIRAAAEIIEFHPLPACRVYPRDATGYLTSHEQCRLRTEFTDCELLAYIQKRSNWTAQVMMPSAGLPTD